MARFCTECGNEIADGVAFCTECGTKAPEAEAEQPQQAAQPAAQPAPQPAPQPRPVVQQAPPVQPVYQQPVQPVYQQVQPVYQQAPYGGDTPPPAGSKYEPISTGGFIGIFLLMCIPIIGQILMIVWACGGCRKVVKRNYARASLIMFVIVLALALVVGFVAKDFIANFLEEAGITEATGKTQQEENSGGFLAGLFGGEPETDENDDYGLGALSGLLGGEENSGDLDDLDALAGLLGGLGALAGGEDSGDLSGLLGSIEDANKQAEAASDGWPKHVRPYPGGKISSTTSYRTEISDTTAEELQGFIADLKKDGFKYQDFYDFGMSEEDMLDMNSWWGTDGEVYLSMSYYDGVVTIDHVYELPSFDF